MLGTVDTSAKQTPLKTLRAVVANYQSSSKGRVSGEGGQLLHLSSVQGESEDAKDESGQSSSIFQPPWFTTPALTDAGGAPVEKDLAPACRPDGEVVDWFSFCICGQTVCVCGAWENEIDEENDQEEDKDDDDDDEEEDKEKDDEDEDDEDEEDADEDEDEDELERQQERFFLIPLNP